MEQHIPFHLQLKRDREQAGLSQAELAEKIGSDRKTVQRWERGESSPQPLYRRRLHEQFGKNAKEFGILDEPQEAEADNASLPYPREDWGEAPRGSICYGREQELERLKQWIVPQQCRIVAVLGIGGIGKTTLTTSITQQVKDEFDYVFWRSLHNAPPLSSILQQCIQFISDQQRIDLPERIDEQISVLISYLKKYRCLLVLDNIESILRSGPRPGNYQPGYENYGELLQRLGEVPHQSCLLLTSREKPGEVAHLEGLATPVRSLPLAGVKRDTGQELLQDRNLLGSPEQWSRLVDLYSGNPLALKLASEAIQNLFGGSIGRFLQTNEFIFGDINGLLEQQFKRLSPQELELLYWLAIEREPVLLEEVQANLVRIGLHYSVVDTLNSLRRRFLLESGEAGSFALQPVILEYITSELVKRACDEFLAPGPANPVIWLNYALVKALAKEYVRESQIRLILAPIAQYLVAEVGEEGIEQKLKEWLALRRQASARQSGYLAGNALNFLNFLQRDLRNADFSRVTIRQAYLQDMQLPNVDFSYAHFESTAFTNIFGNVLSIACSRTKDLMAVGTATGEIWVYEILTGVPVLSLSGHTDSVWSVAFSPDEHMLASSGDDRTIRLWSLATGQCVSLLTEHTHRIRSVAFSPDGRILASGCDDHSVRLWDVQKNQYLSMLQGHTDRIWSVAFSPDGSALASGSNDQTIRLWDTATGACLSTLQGHSGWIWSVAFNTDGTLLASGSEDLTVRLWDVDTGHCSQTLQGHLQGVRALAFQPTGNLLVSGGDDQTIRLWDVATGHSLKTLQGYTRRVWSVAFSPDGQSLVSSCEDRRIRLWNITTGQCYKTLLDRIHGVRSVIFSPDGQTLASGGEDQTVRLWSVASGRCLQTLRGHKKWVRSVAFSADGKWLASGSEDTTVWLWNVTTGQGRIIPQGHTHWVRSVMFSPNGNLLASGSDDQTIRLWDLNADQSFSILSGHTNSVRSIDFNADSSLLASGSEDRTIRIWDVSTGSTRLALEGHTNWIRSVVFSPDGNLLASSSDDHTLRLWSVADGTCLEILHDHSDRVRTIAFSPNGQLLASGSDDGDIKLWNVQEAVYLKNLINEKPYAGMNITGASGLTEAQKETLRSLGAIDI